MLWDKEKKTIVNNESSEITKMFNFEFNNFAKHPDVNLYPAHLKSNIEQVNSWTYNSINNGVYRCGFATKQKPYEEVYYIFKNWCWVWSVSLDCFWILCLSIQGLLLILYHHFALLC